MNKGIPINLLNISETISNESRKLVEVVELHSANGKWMSIAELERLVDYMGSITACMRDIRKLIEGEEDEL